jgi:hypothetical protein
MRKPSDPRFESLSSASKRSKEGKTMSMSTTETRDAKRSLGARMLALPEEDLTESRHSKVFAEVPGGSGPDRKEIG